jgi:hypothetical protein
MVQDHNEDEKPEQEKWERIIKVIKQLNKRKSARSISMFDFSTLYTKIPHDKLKHVMGEIVNFCFNGCKGRNIVVNDRQAVWEGEEVSNKNKKLPSFTHESINMAINFLLDNSYFKVRNNSFARS